MESTNNNEHVTYEEITSIDNFGEDAESSPFIGSKISNFLS